METLARLRQEERIRIFQRQPARIRRIAHDVAVTQFRENHFQRPSKTIEHPNRVP